MMKLGINQYDIEEAAAFQLMYRIMTPTSVTDYTRAGLRIGDIGYDKLWDLGRWVCFKYETTME